MSRTARSGFGKPSTTLFISEIGRMLPHLFALTLGFAMPIETVHSPEPAPDVINASIFLAGPSPRKDVDLNWRPDAIEALHKAGFAGTGFDPIPPIGIGSSNTGNRSPGNSVSWPKPI
jgi:hypothetical protein